MDPPSRRSRRSSILKVRQTEVVMESTTVEDEQKQVLKRRVSFHNVKTVQNFGKDDLNLLEGSPFKEKIQETMSSDGILTPGRSLGTPSTPSDAHDLENTDFIDDTMAAFERGPRQRLNYDEVTTYSVADMSFADTTIADLPEPPISHPAPTTAEMTSDNRLPVDMSICDNTFAGDAGMPSVNSNATRYSQVDMSLDVTMNCTSQSGDDTMAALEITCGRGKFQQVPMQLKDSHGTPKLLLETSKPDLSVDETMMALNVRPGQQMSILQHPSEDHEKTSYTYMDDTARAFEDIIPAPPDDNEQKAEDTISHISHNTSDMDITTVCSAAPRSEHESNRLSSLIISPAPSSKNGAESANATYVIEKDLTGQFQDSLMLKSAVLEEDHVEAAEEIKLMSFEKACRSNTESSSMEVTGVRSCESFHAAGDCDATQGTFIETAVDVTYVKEPKRDVNADLTCSPGQSVISDSLRVAATPSSTLHSTLLKTHLESPCAVDRKRQRTTDKCETLEGEHMEVQRKADVSCYHGVGPAAADELLESRLVVNGAKEQHEIADSQENLTTKEAESTAIMDENMDITQETNADRTIVLDNHGLNGTAQMYDTMRTLAEQVEDGEMSVRQNLTTANGSICDSISESTFSRKDVSLLQVGSRFRASTSSRDETVLSVRSIREDTASLSGRMMFDTHSVQVNYVNPEEDQPDCNLIREQIAEELLEKLKEIQQISQSGFEAAVPRLEEVDAVKALAVKNMSTRALSFDDEELLHAVRLTAETEWMNVRKDVARQACTAVEQCITDDEPDLRQLIEDTQVCEDMDEMQREVQKLEEELSGAPSFDDAVEIFSSSERFMKEEEELDRLILAEEIEWVNLELQQARLRNAEIRQRHEWLLQQEKVLEKNAAKVRELKHEITNLRFE